MVEVLEDLEALSGVGVWRESIVLTGYVADEDLAALNSRALTFVYPLLLRGLGAAAAQGDLVDGTGDRVQHLLAASGGGRGRDPVGSRGDGCATRCARRHTIPSCVTR